jgi:hypothetical protein
MFQSVVSMSDVRLEARQGIQVLLFLELRAINLDVSSLNI